MIADYAYSLTTLMRALSYRTTVCVRALMFVMCSRGCMLRFVMCRVGLGNRNIVPLPPPRLSLSIVYARPRPGLLLLPLRGCGPPRRTRSTGFTPPAPCACLLDPGARALLAVALHAYIELPTNKTLTDATHNATHSSAAQLQPTWPLPGGGTCPRYRRTGLSPPEQGIAPQPDRSAWPPP